MMQARLPDPMRQVKPENRDNRSRLNNSKAGNYFEKILEIVRFTIAFQNAIDDDYSCWD